MAGPQPAPSLQGWASQTSTQRCVPESSSSPARSSFSVTHLRHLRGCAASRALHDWLGPAAADGCSASCGSLPAACGTQNLLCFGETRRVKRQNMQTLPVAGRLFGSVGRGATCLPRVQNPCVPRAWSGMPAPHPTQRQCSAPGPACLPALPGAACRCCQLARRIACAPCRRAADAV